MRRLTGKDIEDALSGGKTVRQIAEDEGVSPSSVYLRLERYRRPDLAQRWKMKNQNASFPKASERYQPWTMGEIKELKDRFCIRGETTQEIALAMRRTFKGISRALNRFNIHREEGGI